MQTNVERLIEQLQEHDIRPSHHRIRILQYLSDNLDHPTVDQIYTALKAELPTLSKTTVYNTMTILTEKGLVHQFNYGDNEAQYDLITMEHGHFKCERCGTLYDFEFAASDCIENELEGFAIKDKEVYFKGICKDCLSQ